MVPLKWQFEEFFPNDAAAFLCIALGSLGDALEPGVCWSWESTLNLELNLNTAPVKKYLLLSVLGFMVLD